jgi:hypothetical protein
MIIVDFGLKVATLASYVFLFWMCKNGVFWVKMVFKDVDFVI